MIEAISVPTDRNYDLLGNFLSDWCNTQISFGLSSFNNDVIISGCPYGGCAMLWCADIKAQVLIVPTNDNRICCISVCNDSC